MSMYEHALKYLIIKVYVFFAVINGNYMESFGCDMTLKIFKLIKWMPVVVNFGAETWQT